MKKYTEMESKVIEEMKLMDWFEDMPSGSFEDIQEATKIPTRQLRGVISSLVKKGIFMFGEYPDGVDSFHLIENKI